MNQRATLTWFSALGISAWLSAKAWNPSPIYSPAEAPQALPRPATTWVTVLQLSAQLSPGSMRHKRNKGERFLYPVSASSSTIFDNPLVVTVGFKNPMPEVLEHPAGLDLLLNGSTFMANIPSSSPSNKGYSACKLNGYNGWI